MRVPDELWPLLDEGVIHEVLRPLMSGKEAAVYLVEVDGWPAVAKIFKDAAHRSFKHRASYTEGRRVGNSRSQRAMEKRSRFGRQVEEQAWRTAEVDILYRLRDAGVRVPEPYAFVEGVLVMELICDPDGNPAPRLVDAKLSEDEAWDLFHLVLQDVVRMLCAGVVHGDLSDFNILLAHDGPVLIDFPQAVDAAHNRNARELLIRDVRNLTSFLARYTNRLRKTRYGDEMWALYEAGELRPDTQLTGRHRGPKRPADTTSLLAEIEAMERESRRRRESLGLEPKRAARAPVPGGKPAAVPAGKRAAGPEGKRGAGPGGKRAAKRASGVEGERASSPPAHSGAPPGAPPEGRRKRKRKPTKPPPPATTAEFAAGDDLDAFLLES